MVRESPPYVPFFGFRGSAMVNVKTYAFYCKFSLLYVLDGWIYENIKGGHKYGKENEWIWQGWT